MSPYCFILALQLIYLRHDDNPETAITLQDGTPRAVTIRASKYADDVAIISRTAAETSVRATNIFNGSYDDGKL